MTVTAAPDRIRYCLYRGSELTDWELRRPRCQPVARMPPWFWLAFAAAAGLLPGAWALARGASPFGAGASAVATAGLGFGAITVLLRHPPALIPGRKLSGRGALGMTALVQALSIPGYWGVTDESDLDFSAGGTNR